ncbi:MAG: response regulator [Flavobacteriaceae bacterium]|nr:response regulator [Flavobacteriaceae bacterium]
MTVNPKTQRKHLQESAILNSLNIIILSCDKQGQISYASEGLTKLTGFSREEVLGEGWWKLSFQDVLSGQLQKNIIKDTLNGLLPFSENFIDGKVLCKDGTFRWVSWSFSLGDEHTMVISGVDITDRKQREQSEVKAGKILNSIDSLVILSDRNCDVIYASPSVERVLGYTQEEILGAGWWENTFESASASRVEKKDLNSLVFDEEVQPRAISRRRIKTKQGTYKWIEWFFSKASSNTYIAVGTDISMNVKSDVALIVAKEQAEKSLKSKNEFLANMSHEIRTPLNTLLGFTDVLLETKLDVEQREYLETMRTSGDVLLSLINNVLDLSKLDAAKIAPEKRVFDLHKTVYEVVNMLKVKAQHKGLLLRVDILENTPRYVVSDATRFKQIMLNLMGNAIKFTNIGEVNILVKVEGMDARRLVVEVQDTGIGIMASKLDHIFDAFTQGKKETARIYGGTGLGLSIVKKLVHLLDGTVSVKSTYNKGSIFRFEYPVEVSLKEKAPFRFDPVLEHEKKVAIHVLLVEDNKANQLLARTRLKRWGCTIEIANNGIEAVKMVEKNNPYDLILMDIQMPIMDGYEATKIIKNDLGELRKNIPVVAMTAHASQSEIKRALHVGMSDYILKPFDTAILYQKLVYYSRK